MKTLKRLMKTKVERMIYFILLLWVYMGIVALCTKTDLQALAVYFVSLTGFVGSYVFGEIKRPSNSTSLGHKGKSSKREGMMYIVIFMWVILGTFSLFKGIHLEQSGSYFAALTPFIASYIIGQTLTVTPGTPQEPSADPVDEPPIL